MSLSCEGSAKGRKEKKLKMQAMIVKKKGGGTHKTLVAFRYERAMRSNPEFNEGSNTMEA